MKSFLTLLLLLFLSFHSIAQNDFIEVSPEANQIITVQGPVTSDIKIKVYFHIYRNLDDNLGPNQADIENTLFDLNNGSFSQDGVNISFFYNECETRWVNNDEQYFNTCLDIYFNKFRHLDGIDIHLKDNTANHGNLAAGIISDEFVIGGNQQTVVNNINMTLLHEMGHCLGLFHTYHGHCVTGEVECFGDLGIESNCLQGDFVADTNPYSLEDVDSNCNIIPGTSGCLLNTNCIGIDFSDPPVTNIMSGTGVCMSSFTQDQMLRMNELAPALTTHADNFGCCYEQGYDWIIDEDKNFDFEQNVGGDLYITNGATLTITENTNFYENKKIIIEQGSKLIIGNNAILGPCDDSFLWGGIQLRDNGVVDNSRGVFASNSTIYKATTGITQNSENYGGYMALDHVTFEDCIKGIELMKYEGNETLDIDHCTFINGQYGITSWANNFNITNCQFSGFEKSAILGFNSSPTINGGNLGVPNFISCNDAITLAYTSGQFNTTEIFNNHFFGNRYEVHVLSGASMDGEARTFIHNNLFEGSYVAVYFDAANKYKIENNDFINCEIGNFTRAAGVEQNEILLNEYAGSTLGAWYSVQNTDTDVSQNCYDNHFYTDLFVHGDFMNQGNAALANGNCFSLTNPEIRTAIATQSFDYFILENMIEPDCRLLVENDFSYDVEDSSNSRSADNCGSNFAILNIPYSVDYPCKPHKNETDVRNAINDLKDIITSLENNTILSTDEVEDLISHYENCLRRVTLLLVDILIKEDRTTDAVQTLIVQDEFQMQIKGYFVYVHKNSLTQARSYLQTLSPVSTEESDFVNTQLIYIESLINENFNPRQSDLTNIRSAGEKNTVLAGFSRSVYLYFTDVLIELDLNLEGHNLQPRNEVSNELDIRVYPNPVYTEGLTIDGLRINDNETNSVVIRDILGTVILEKKNIDTQKVQLDNFEGSGVFILSVYKNGKIQHSEKVIKL